MEWFIANQDGAGGIGTAKEEEMEEVVRRFGRNGPENGDERGAGVEMKVEWREERIQDTEDDEGGRMKKRVRLNDQDGATNGSRERTDSVGGGDTSAAVDAAVDLEYATLGRSRTTFPTSQDRLPSPSESPQVILFFVSATPLLTNLFPGPKYTFRRKRFSFDFDITVITYFSYYYLSRRTNSEQSRSYYGTRRRDPKNRY